MNPSPTASDTRTALVDLHQELVRSGLVAWTSGNVSSRARLDDQDVFVIKPSGVAYPEPVPDVAIDALFRRYQNVYGQRDTSA